jgi:hypothetical protein
MRRPIARSFLVCKHYRHHGCPDSRARGRLKDGLLRVVLRCGVCRRTGDLLKPARTLAIDGAACQPQTPRLSLDPSETSLARPRGFRAVVSVVSETRLSKARLRIAG